VAFAFRDANHGVILRDCSVLLETHDGGATWQEQAAPWLFLRDAFWWHETLWLAGTGGVFRRGPGQSTFERVIDAPSCELARGPGGLAAVCQSMDGWPWQRGYLFPKGGDAQPLAKPSLPTGYPADVDEDGVVTLLAPHAVLQWTRSGMKAIATMPAFADTVERFRDAEAREREWSATSTPTK
jgi:hypothetical protein